MNIYDLSEKEFKELRKKFDKTCYGKRIIMTNFCLPVIGTIVMFILVIQMVICYAIVSSWSSDWFLPIVFAFPVVIVGLLTLISFVRGYHFYYSEFKEYVSGLKKGK